MVKPVNGRRDHVGYPSTVRLGIDRQLSVALATLSFWPIVFGPLSCVIDERV